MSNTRSYVLEMVEDIVDRHRFAVIPVGTGVCAVPGCTCTAISDPYAYTVGVAIAGGTEYVVTALDATSSHGGLSLVANAALAGDPFPVGPEFTLAGMRARLDLVPVEWLVTDMSRIGAWWPILAERVGGAPAIAQLVWSDDHGRFPDEPGCDPRVVRDQRLLAVDPFSYPRPENRAERRAAQHAARRAERRYRR